MNQPIRQPGSLCARCYNLTHRRDSPSCSVCGRPYGPDMYSIDAPTLKSSAGELLALPEDRQPNPGSPIDRVASVLSDKWRPADTVRKLSRTSLRVCKSALEELVESGEAESDMRRPKGQHAPSKRMVRCYRRASGV